MRVEGQGSRVWVCGFRADGLGLGFRDEDLGLKVWGLGLRVKG